MIRTKLNRKKKLFTDINITPFTDVCLVLLIIFMVTAKPLFSNERSIQINLPKSTTASEPIPPSVVVRITADEQFFLNNEPVSFAEMGPKMKAMHDEQGATLLVVRADEQVPYRLVITTIDIANQAGLTQLGLAARQVAVPPLP